jgi:hypothetical protein
MSLDPIRHGEVYQPGEEPPEDGKRQPFFGPGIWSLLFSIVVIAVMLWSGIPQAIGDIAGNIVASILR